MILCLFIYRFLLYITLVGLGLTQHLVSSFVFPIQSTKYKKAIKSPILVPSDLKHGWFTGVFSSSLNTDYDLNCQSNDDTRVRQLSYIPDESANILELIDFLDEEECEGIDDTCIGLSLSNGLRGLYAKTSFQVGEYILAIPAVTAMEIMVTTDKESNEVDKGLSLLKCLLGTATSIDNRWHRYLQSLPTIDHHFDATCDFWNESDSNELQIPSLVRESLEKKKHIDSVANTNHVNPNELHFATWLARSRMFTRITTKMPNKNDDVVKTNMDNDETNNSSLNDEEVFFHRTVLIPYMDMINHSYEGNSIISILEGRSDEESMYCLQATQEINVGDEILITYGTGFETTLELFMKYGFFDLSSSATYDTNDFMYLDFSQLEPLWTTTIEQDIEILSKMINTGDNNATTSNKQKAIALRLYLKKLQHWKNTQST